MHTLKPIRLCAVLAAMLLAQSAFATETPRFRLHAGIASDALGGGLLKTSDGLAQSIDYDDAFDRSDRQAIGVGFLLAPNQELSLYLGLDRANGATLALGAVNGVRQAGALSHFEALRYELAYRYSFADMHASGFYLGAQIGRERHNAVSVRLANGRVETLFNRSSGYSYGLSAGYQWAFNPNMALSLAIAPTSRPGFEVNRQGAAALGITRSNKTSGAISSPITLQFSYSF